MTTATDFPKMMHHATVTFVQEKVDPVRIAALSLDQLAGELPDLQEACIAELNKTLQEETAIEEMKLIRTKELDAQALTLSDTLQHFAGLVMSLLAEAMPAKTEAKSDDLRAVLMESIGGIEATATAILGSDLAHDPDNADFGGYLAKGRWYAIDTLRQAVDDFEHRIKMQGITKPRLKAKVSKSKPISR